MLPALISAVSSILIAFIAIIPSIKSNRKQTQKSFEDAMKKTDKTVEEIKSTLDSHIREEEDTTARNRRYRILRFYDEMCEGRLHSESHFEDILEDIDEYEKYCNKHKDFKNNRGEIAMKYIADTYKKIKTRGGFLLHDEKGGSDNEAQQ